MNAYIVKDGEIVCSVKTELKNGTKVIYSWNRCDEKINASREFNLVNARTGKISRAKKYDQYRMEFSSAACLATEINPGEFYLESLCPDYEGE